MSVIPCVCGGVTNTAVSDHLMLLEDNKAHGCYAKWENGHWIPGCRYGDATPFEKKFADSLIQG